MKNVILRSIVMGTAAVFIGLCSSTAALAHHWHHTNYGGYYGPGPGYWRTYSAPVVIDRGWGWHRHHWYRPDDPYYVTPSWGTYYRSY